MSHYIYVQHTWFQRCGQQVGRNEKQERQVQHKFANETQITVETKLNILSFVIYWNISATYRLVPFSRKNSSSNNESKSTGIKKFKNP